MLNNKYVDYTTLINLRVIKTDTCRCFNLFLNIPLFLVLFVGGGYVFFSAGRYTFFALNLNPTCRFSSNGTKLKHVVLT